MSRRDRTRAARKPAAGPGPRQPTIPRATYRVQLNGEFRFEDLEAIVPYLDALGISHCYCSPYLKARPGSSHGYDIVDHAMLNPEIGDRGDLDRLGSALAERNMGQILDVVPNHMAVMGRDNVWWLDVLEHGMASRYAPFFDIDWQPLKHELAGKVLVPVLGDHYGNVLDEGGFELVFDSEQGTFSIDYYEHRFPVDPREYPLVLAPDLERLRERMPEADGALLQLESLITALAKLPPRTSFDEESKLERARDRDIHLGRLAELASSSPDIGSYIDECMRAFNGDENRPADLERMHGLLEAQAYRLAYWRVASDEINYRRFFDINELAALRQENPQVFEATHALVLELVAAGKLDGLRIDHPDGLYDPRAYFRSLQQRAGAQPDSDERPLYLIAEKILAHGESLRADWPVHGTTGYEFGNLISRYLVDPAGINELESIAADFLGEKAAYPDVLYRSKRLIMQTALASELGVLVADLDRLAEQDPHTRDFGLGGLRNALLETIACFPVYRTYVVGGAPSDADVAAIERAVQAAKARSEAADTSVFDFLRDVLLNRGAPGRDAGLRAHVARFGMQLQQYTSPVAAKGMEDTAFYRYARLVSLNEVGGTPERPTASAEAVHAANAERRSLWPHSLLGTSSHDSKRSEDLRARLQVLSEIPAEWRRLVERWGEINEPLKPIAPDGRRWPERVTEYLLYQTLLGAWPLDELAGEARARFRERIEAYMLKAVKEAKVHTSWINPNADYESALSDFVRALLDPTLGASFLEGFLPLERRVAQLGLYNALTQLVLKLTSPGVPDIYQGNELWRFDLVDPDNRRPVDFARRRELLAGLRKAHERAAGPELARELVASIGDGRLKLFVTWRLLSLRRNLPELLERGDYLPLNVRGGGADHVLAFARRAGGRTLVTVVLRGFASLCADDGRSFEAARLADTEIALPRAPAGYRDVLWARDDGPAIELPAPSKDGKRRVRAAKLMATAPVAVLLARET